ncbi:6971_t:CDS:2, partial [Dentiscutata heterogama]
VEQLYLYETPDSEIIREIFKQEGSVMNFPELFKKVSILHAFDR